MTLIWILVACAPLVMAAISFHRAAFVRFVAGELTLSGFGAGVWLLARPVDPHLALVIAGVAMLALFSIALAFEQDVRWSAGRAALLAAIVYACVAAAQIQKPVDGDESYYVLIAESILHDHDVDLRNQYAHLERSITGRRDLVPQEGDLTGPRGEKYSRLEPFLPLLLVPGVLAAGLPGALATIALFGVLLVRSTVRLLEEEGIDDATIRALFPLFAFAPPVIYYVARVWPEVPGAFCMVEAVRGVRRARPKRAIPALVALVLLKLRFGLIGAVLAGAMAIDAVRGLEKRRKRLVALSAAILVLPLTAVWAISGHLLSVHSWRELIPSSPANYAVGTFGLLVDGGSGVLFAAPFYLLGIFALFYFRTAPAAFRLGVISALPYLVSLVPRSEWHGGWSPPLRYVVVFMPVLFLGAAALAVRFRRGEASPLLSNGVAAFIAPVALWSAGLTIHGLAYPWRLFHIESGENPIGEWLSVVNGADVSRMFPSYVRLNHAAWIAAVALVLAALLFRFVRVPAQWIAPLLALTIAAGYLEAQRPGRVIEFEDAHVIHSGGELYPELYTVARFYYRSGWMLHRGDSVTFRAPRGPAKLEYACATPVTIEIGGGRVVLPPTGNTHAAAEVFIPRDGATQLRCLDGTVALDRMTHE